MTVAPANPLPSVCPMCGYCPTCRQASRESSLDVPISVLHFSPRISNALESSGIKTVRELSYQTDADLTQLRGMGQCSRREVRQKLEARGLFVGMEPPT